MNDAITSRTYEAVVRIYTPHDLTNEQLRAWGDAMSDSEELVASNLIDSGVTFQIETHGPFAVFDTAAST
jgi:hypothetical protein